MGVKAKTVPYRQRQQVEPNGLVIFWRKYHLGEILHTIIVYSLLLALTVVFLFPFFWMLTSALKQDQHTSSGLPNGSRTRFSGITSKGSLRTPIYPSTRSSKIR